MGVADDGGAFRHTVTYGVVEANLVQELLYLGVEGGAAQDHFLELATEGVGKFRAELLLNHLVQHRDAAIVFGLVHQGLELALVHLLHDQGHSDDDVRMDLAEGLHDDFGAGNAAQEVHVHTDGHLKEELEHHTVHMGRRKHGDHVHTGFEHGAGILGGELYVGVDGAVRNHDTLGEAGSTGGVVNDGQLFGTVFVIMKIFRAEAVGIPLAEFLVQVLTHVAEGLRSGIQELEVVDLDHYGKVGHLFGTQAFPDDLVYKEDAGLGVVDQIMDISGFELVQDGDGHSAIGNGGHKAHTPVGLVAGADGYLVSFLETAHLKGNVQLGDTEGYLTVGQRHTLIVGQGRAVPVLDQAFLKRLVNGLEFHGILIGFSSI